MLHGITNRYLLLQSVIWARTDWKLTVQEQIIFQTNIQEFDKNWQSTQHLIFSRIDCCSQFSFTVKTHQSSGSQSRNPLANGLLAILSWVICNMTIVITRPDLGYQSDIIRVWVSRRLMSSCQAKAPPDNDIKWAKAALPTLPLPTLTRRETNCWNQRN